MRQTLKWSYLGDAIQETHKGPTQAGEYQVNETCNKLPCNVTIKQR